MADNKPILPNAYVNVNNRNLGLIPATPSGIFAFTGIGIGGTAALDAIVSVGNPSDVSTLIGFGELADDLLDFFNAGGRRAIAIPLDVETSAVIGAVTPTLIGTATGTITLAASGSLEVTNDLLLRVDITKTGTVGVGKFKYSTDNGVNYSPSILIPSGAVYVIPGTNLEITFVPGAGAVFFELGDYHTATIDKPEPLTADVTTAIQTFIDSEEAFDAIIAAVDLDAAAMLTIKGKMTTAMAKPNFRYAYALCRPETSANGGAALTAIQTIRATIEDDRMQVSAAEVISQRPNHGDQFHRNVTGIIAGRRSALNIQNDLGRVNAGSLANIISYPDTSWTNTIIEDLDGERVVTIRRFKGVAGFFPTNGWMTDPFSDMKKDAWRLLTDKASRIARLVALDDVKIEIDPTDTEGSTKHLRNKIKNQLDTNMTAKKECVETQVEIIDNPDILTDETLKVTLGVLPFGHASFIEITVALVNPLTASAA